MAKAHLRVLAVGGGEVKVLAPHLRELPCVVEWARDGRTAGWLAQKMKFHHLLVGYPLEDMKIADFVAELRRPESASSVARMLLVTTEELLPEAMAVRDEGFITGALSVDGPSATVASGLAGFMKTSARLSARMPAQMILLEGSGPPIDGETVNLSESGVLVRSTAVLARGAEIRFELRPRGVVPIRCRALVVRLCSPEFEQMQGLGLRFLDFESDGRERLNVLIRGLLAESVG